MKNNCTLFVAFFLLWTVATFGQGDVFMTLGNEAFKKKNYSLAVENYTSCLAANPKHTGCLFNRGLARKIAVSMASAVEDFTAVIALQPTHAKAYEQRGSCYEAMKRDADALNDFNRAIQLDPQSANAYWYRGLLFKKMKDPTRALADFSKMIEVAPNDARGYSYRGDTYRENKQFDQAINDYTQAIQRDATNASALYHRGLIYFERGKTELAEPDFTRASALDKTYESLVRGVKTLARSKAISEKTVSLVPPVSNVFGLWEITLQFGTASKTYALFLENNTVQSPSVMYIINADRYELKDLQITANGGIGFDLVMGKADLIFTGKIAPDGQKMVGQFSYLYDGKTSGGIWSAQRPTQK